MAHVAKSPVVMLTGEVDLGTLDELDAALQPLRGHVVVDLDSLSFLDCAGIGTFVKARNRLARDGGDLRLRAPAAHVRRVLETVCLDDWIIDRPRTAELPRR